MANDTRISRINSLFPKRKPHTDSILLSDGILLSGVPDRAQEKGSTALNLLVRAFFLFAMVTGSLGGMLSAFNISYAKWAFFLTAFLVSLYCS